MHMKVFCFVKRRRLANSSRSCTLLEQQALLSQGMHAPLRIINIIVVINVQVISSQLIYSSPRKIGTTFESEKDAKWIGREKLST